MTATTFARNGQVSIYYETFGDETSGVVVVFDVPGRRG